MNTTNNTTVRIYEQPGKLGALKASQLARLIEAYAIAHPEVTGPTDAKKEDTDNANRTEN